jgi:hypothetical protein
MGFLLGWLWSRGPAAKRHRVARQVAGLIAQGWNRDAPLRSGIAQAPIRTQNQLDRFIAQVDRNLARNAPSDYARPSLVRRIGRRFAGARKDKPGGIG